MTKKVQHRLPRAAAGLTMVFCLSSTFAHAQDTANPDSQDLPNMGQQITPLAPPGARFEPMNPDLTANPSWLAGQAVTTVASPDGKTLLVLCSGFNVVFTGSLTSRITSQFAFIGISYIRLAFPKSGSRHSTNAAPPEANGPNPGQVFPSGKFIFWRLVMKRISIVILILGTCFVPAAWGQKITCPTQFNWTEFHTIDMARWNPCEKVLNVNNVGNLQLLWSYNTNNTGLGYVESSPAVANGGVYVGSYFGSLGGNLYALNAKTGAKLWSYATATITESSPAVANGVVYVGSSGLSDTVYALNANTGAKLWSYKTGNWVDSSPAVANGIVYVGSLDGNVYALNARTGAILWAYTTGIGVLQSSPAVANGVVYVGSENFVSKAGAVYALDAQTGALRWTVPSNYVSSAPAVANGLVYVGSYDNNVYALNAKTGSMVWSYTTGGQVGSSPAVADGVVYVGSFDGNVNALNARTGALL